jgi:hypothetical protein
MEEPGEQFTVVFALFDTGYVGMEGSTPLPH